MVKDKYERKNLFLKHELVEVLDFLSYKRKKSLKFIVNNLLEKAVREEFKYDPNILLQLKLEAVEPEEEKEILEDLNTLAGSDKKPALRRWYDEVTGVWKEQELY